MDNITLLVVSTSILVCIPGPNVALIVANSLRHGLNGGLLTTFGTTVGVALQLVLVVAGMATIIESAAAALTWIRWAGVLYLAYLGFRAWQAPAADFNVVRAGSVAGVFWRGLALAAINPKTLLFSAAFLPQFVSGDVVTMRQLLLIAAVYLGIIFTGDSLWAIFASSARRFLGRFSHLRNRITGAFLLSAAAGLALSRRST